MEQSDLHELKLHIAPDKFYIEAVGRNLDLVVIDRISYDITLQSNGGQIPETASSLKIFGVLGRINLIAGPYLVVLVQREKVGDIDDHVVYKLTKAEVIPYSKTTLHLTDRQIVQNEAYLSMVYQMLDTPSYYFSYTYDLSHSLQRLHSLPKELSQKSLFERSDGRFIWNGHLLETWSNNRPDLLPFCLPIVFGYVAIDTSIINGKSVTWMIISRRCKFRAGTRMFVRGIDKYGEVANFVETEQIVKYKDEKCSFVQTRGSIPLYWQQYPNLRYKPPPTLVPRQDHHEAFTRHFRNQVNVYGKQVIVNLVDQKGSEGALETSFKEQTQQSDLPQVKYEAFDFHRECSKMRWERLEILLNRLAQDQLEMGYFHVARDGIVLSQQLGVFRTNCIDCLDRTNVVQSKLALRSMQQQLLRLGILKPEQQLTDQRAFQAVFRNLWTNNADDCSIQYSGTKALKTDYTRTGKRTPSGAWEDLKNSLRRYVKNNFQDGYRQDSYDLFLGNYMVDKGECSAVSCPLEEGPQWQQQVFPLVAVLSLVLFFIILLFSSVSVTIRLLYMLFFATIVFVSIQFMFKHGREFVQNPKLCPLPDSKNLM